MGPLRPQATTCSPAWTRPPNRWRRALDFVDVGLGDAMGRLYVARYFSPQALRYVIDRDGWQAAKARPPGRGAR